MILGILAAACGSAAPNGAATTTSNPALTQASSAAASTAPAPAATPVVVRAEMIQPLGTVLVDTAGRTLYMFTPDKQTAVTCTGSCAEAWPPLVIAGDTAVAGPGIEASQLGTVQAPDGKMQITYNHWPLYTFTGDAAPSQATGQGLDDKWFAVTVAGAQAPSPPAPTAALGAATTTATSATPALTTPPTSPPPITAPVTTAQRVTPPSTTAPRRTTPPSKSPATTGPATGGAGF